MSTTSRKIYLDWNSYGITAPIMLEKLRESGFANPASKHSLGQRNRARMLELSRILLSELGFSGTEMNITYTSGATEANFSVLNSYDCVFVSDVEHPSVRECPHAEIMPVDAEGQMNCEILEDKLQRMKGDRFLVSYMLANHETGIINNLAPVIAMTKKYGGHFHTDAVQAFGRIDIAPHVHDVDYMTLCPYKAGGMMGIGALIHRYPVQFGWSCKRNGTVSVQLIECMIATLGLPRSSNEVLEQNLSPEIQIIGKNQSRLPNTTCIICKDKMKLLMALDLKGICVSSGAACSAGTSDKAHSLTAMGYDVDTIRISSGWATSSEDLMQCAEWVNRYAV